MVAYNDVRACPRIPKVHKHIFNSRSQDKHWLNKALKWNEKFSSVMNELILWTVIFVFPLQLQHCYQYCPRKVGNCTWLSCLFNECLSVSFVLRVCPFTVHACVCVRLRVSVLVQLLLELKSELSHRFVLDEMHKQVRDTFTDSERRAPARLHTQAREHAQHLSILNSTCVTSSTSSQGCSVNRQRACLPLAAVASPPREAGVEKPHSAADAAGRK